MQVGVICGDRYHPADVIKQGLAPLESDFNFDYILDTIDWSNDTLEKYDVIVLTKGNARSPEDWAPWLSKDVQQAFVNFVERGGGLFVVHSGTVGYADDPLFCNLVGGVFVHHPENCDVTVESRENAVIPAVGAQTFEVYDEHYFVKTFGDDLNFFMTSTSKNGEQPAGWTRQQGKGRVCVMTPGHFTPVWINPVYNKMIAAGLDWCAGKQS